MHMLTPGYTYEACWGVLVHALGIRDHRVCYFVRFDKSSKDSCEENGYSRKTLRGYGAHQSQSSTNG